MPRGLYNIGQPDFNPRSPTRGATTGGAHESLPPRTHFNPRSPTRGATVNEFSYAEVSLFQSTLPYAGSDFCSTCNTERLSYFNPRSPTRGATCIPPLLSFIIKFQSTLPYAGSDVSSSYHATMR